MLGIYLSLRKEAADLFISQDPIRMLLYQLERKTLSSNPF